MTPDEVEWAAGAWREGWTIAEIAEECGTDILTAARALGIAGPVPRVRRWRVSLGSTGSAFIGSLVAEVARARYRNGETAAALAREAGVARSGMWSRVTR